MIKQNKYLIVFSLVLLGAISIFLLWNMFNQRLNTGKETLREETEETAVNSNVPISQRASFERISDPERRAFSEESGLNVPVLPIPQPKIDDVSESEGFLPKYVAFFENIKKAAETVQEVVEKKVSTPTTQNPGVLSSTFSATSTEEIRLMLSDEEFSYLYPASFLEDLKDGQNLLKEYDPSYEPIPEIKTDSHVRLIQEKIVVALLSANMIDKNEAQRYITTIRFTLPQIQLFELEARKQALEKRPFTQKVADFFDKVFLKTKEAPKGIFLAGLVEQLENALLPTAQAGGGPCGECHILPICVQEGLATPTIGTETWTPFCQCTGCLYGQGCLDRCFPAAAIWDPATGICGCGI